MQFLCHPLGHLPRALKNIPPADVIPQPCAQTIEGITIVQKIRGDQNTFAEVADSMISIVLHERAEN